MTDIKLYTTDELKKMNLKDRNELLRGTEAEKAQYRLQLRMGKEKKSDKYVAYKKQIARIKSINNQPNEK